MTACIMEEDRGYATPCLISQQRGRYARTRRGGKMLPLHRALWEDEHGPVPEGCELDHLCRQSLCIRVDHLEPVTHAVNARRSTSSPLTQADADEIRRLGEDLLAGRSRRPRGSREAVAQRFGVDVKTITNIWRGYTWA